MANVVSVQITASSRPEADKIARALVAEKLAACVNIFPGVHSIYRWEGKVEEGDEVLMIAKTQTDKFEALRKFVTAMHSYKCPMIVALPVTAGHAPYLDWVAQETIR